MGGLGLLCPRRMNSEGHANTRICHRGKLQHSSICLTSDLTLYYTAGTHHSSLIRNLIISDSNVIKTALTAVLAQQKG